MSLQRDVRHGVRIGRAEFVQSMREYFRDKRRLVGLTMILLFFGGSLLFALPTVYDIGQTARSVGVIPYFASAATALPVALLVLSTLRTLERIGNIETEDLILMTVHLRAVIVGLIGAEIARLVMWFGVPLGALVTAFALGLGSPSLLVTSLLVAVPLVCWAAVWGYACGIAVLRLLRQLPGLRRTLKLCGILTIPLLIVGSQFVGQYSVREGIPVQILLPGITFEPLRAYAAFAFVGTPLAQPTSVNALAILVVLIALTPVGLIIATEQASTLWFTETVSHRGTQQMSTSVGRYTPPRPFVWTNAGRIAWGHLLRGIRQPQEFSHLVMLLFVIGPFGTTIVQSSGDALGILVAGSGVGLGTYLAGATFGLNPLGDDRPQLPLILLTETDPRTIVQSRLFAGLAVGIPVVVLIPIASIIIGTPPLYGFVFAAVGVGMCLAAALFGVGIGSAYPIYEEREFWGTETVVPSTGVMMLYMFVVGGDTILGLIVTWYVITGHLVVTPIAGLGLSVYLLLTVAVPYGSYRYAIGRYQQYSVA